MTGMKEKFNQIYKAIFDLPISVYAKRKALEEICMYEKEFPFWSIKGITEKALEELRKRKFDSFKGIQRAHVLDRVDRGNELFDRATPKSNAYEYFFENDSVILATKKENDLNELGPMIELDPTEFGRPTFSIHMSKAKRSYLESKL